MPVKVRPITAEGAPDVASGQGTYSPQRLDAGFGVYSGAVADKAVRVTQGVGGVIADIYDPAADRWKHAEGPRTSDLLRKGTIDRVRAFVAGRRLIVTWDGSRKKERGFGPLTLLTVVLDIDSATFREMPAEGEPDTLRGHVAFAGGSLLVWHGAPSISPPPIAWEHGYRFDFDKWRWSPLPSAGAPSVRSLAVVETIGDRVVVWGGGTGPMGALTTLLGDGAVFNAASSEWKPIASDHAPPARYDAIHAAGDRHVLVWGGHEGPSDKSSAFVYDVAQDHWSASSGAAAPQLKVAASTGWGGRVVRAGDRIAAVLNDATWVIDLPAATWTSMGVPPPLPASSVGIGRRGVAFVGEYGRPDAPKDVPIVFLDLVNNRWCVPKVGIVPPLNASKIALLWGTERGIGAFGAIDFQASSCPPGAPCPYQEPRVQAQSVGAMIDW